MAAWRHIVTLFRDQGASNVTWLWTVNALAGAGQRITDPTPWWPGSAYVTWVGIDGYYYLPSETFNVLFGDTIKEVRKLTGDPILIAETGAAPAAGKAAKIADAFAGVRADKLLGLVWFDAVGSRDWRISPARPHSPHSASKPASFKRKRSRIPCTVPFWSPVTRVSPMTAGALNE